MNLLKLWEESFSIYSDENYADAWSEIKFYTRWGLKAKYHVKLRLRQNSKDSEEEEKNCYKSDRLLHM